MVNFALAVLIEVVIILINSTAQIPFSYHTDIYTNSQFLSQN
jgi:hypothetical protein